MIKSIGFDVVETGLDVKDAEQKARQAEINQQRHLLIVGLIFTIPLFFLSMTRDILMPAWAEEPWYHG